MSNPLTTPPANGTRSPGSTGPAGRAPSGTTGSVPSSTSTTAAKALNGSLVKALGVALSCEQAAVWSYGLVAAYLPDHLDLLSRIRAGHLARRDATAALIVNGRGRADPPAAAYAVPPVSTAKAAWALAVTLESECAAAWQVVLGSTDDQTLRAAAFSGLSDSAVWLTQVKMAAKLTPLTVPFPGRS